MQEFNSRNEFYKYPFGAVAECMQVKFKIALSESNFTPSLIIGKYGDSFEHLPMTLDSETDGKYIFTVCFTPKVFGLYFYKFNLGNGLEIFNGGKGNGSINSDGQLFQLTVYRADFKTPEQVKGGIFYQIFPDSFYESSPKDRLAYADRIYKKDKSEEPFYSSTDKHRPITKDYYGGDLKGIAEKLGYLKELGVNYIYLNPIFEAHSNHRYNTADYLQIDKDLGTQEDFTALCSAAKKMGIYIILDGVFSHTGSDSIYFNKSGRYGTGGAFRDENSLYRRWYDFSDKYPQGYRCWWGFETLPEIDENNESYINFICGENGVIDYWLAKGAQGFRLDVADELPDSFISSIRKAVKRHGADKLVVGEVWEDASNKISFGSHRKYLLGDGLDTTMNYPFRSAILNFLRYGGGDKLCETVMTICENYPKEALDTAWNSLSTHDTPRAMTWLGGDNPDGNNRQSQSQHFLSVESYEKNAKLIVCGFCFTFTLPGVPCIYYGDEIGMQGYRDPFNRAYFRWWSIDCNILNAVKALSKQRMSCPLFKDGRIHFIFSDVDCVAFIRYFDENQVLIAVNRGQTQKQISYRDNIYTVQPISYIICDVI